MMERALKPKLVFKNDYGTLYKGDCVEWMRGLAAECADLIFADPPFNLKKDYGPSVKDDLSEESYLNWSYQWIDEAVRLLKPGAGFWLYNLPKWNLMLGAYLLGEKGLTFRHQIAVNMTTGLPIPGKLIPSHYSLLYFTKGKPKYFERPRKPFEVCRHCGGEIKDYGGQRKHMNPQGVNLSDVWTDINPVRHRKNVQISNDMIFPNSRVI